MIADLRTMLGWEAGSQSIAAHPKALPWAEIQKISKHALAIGNWTATARLNSAPTTHRRRTQRPGISSTTALSTLGRRTKIIPGRHRIVKNRSVHFQLCFSLADRLVHVGAYVAILHDPTRTDQITLELSRHLKTQVKIVTLYYGYAGGGGLGLFSFIFVKRFDIIAN